MSLFEVCMLRREGVETKERKGEGEGKVKPWEKNGTPWPLLARLPAIQEWVAGPDSHGQPGCQPCSWLPWHPQRLSFRRRSPQSTPVICHPIIPKCKC